MFDPKKKMWISDCQDSELLEWAMDGEQKENPKALFLIASDLLAQKDQWVDAVYYMEKSAKMSCIDAMIAMGQMYTYGYGVGKNDKYALNWYQKAADLGDERAITYLTALKKKRQKKWIIRFACSFCCLGILISAIFIFYQMAQRVDFKVVVNDDTTLNETEDFVSFEKISTEMVEKYDDEETKMGNKSTNRLIVGYQGKKLDLSDFSAIEVVSRPNGTVIIQFANEEDAKECYEQLLELENVRYVEFDTYENNPTTTNSTDDLPLAKTTYMSWGIEAMQMDELASYIIENDLNSDIRVAVIDSGIQIPSEMANRILEGKDYVDQGNGWSDNNGHGTHVAGTILDATRGLNVSIIPIRIFNGNQGASTLLICNAIEYAISQSPQVINMSLGGPISQDSNYEREVILNAIDEGIVVVVAAGNGDNYGNPVDTAGIGPAFMEECIVVAALDSSGQIASFSNYGESVDVAAPGVNIKSYGIDGNQYAVMDGTSMATPHVSALASMLCMLYPNASPAQIEQYMKYYCEVLGNPLYYGEGLPLGSFFVED